MRKILPRKIKQQILRVGFLLLASGGLAMLQAATSETPTVGSAEKRIYKKTPQGELALYINFPPGWQAQDKRPAVVFFFGGGWTSGNVDQFKTKAEYLATRGMVAARADYRIKSRHGTTMDKCVEDGKSAIRWVRQNAAKLGVDSNRIVAAGGSAGGHVAASTFMVTGCEAEGEDHSISSQPNLLILFNPVLDVTEPKIMQHYAANKPAAALSPNLHLSQQTPPTVLFFGTKDGLLAQSKTYLQQAKQLGFEARLYTAEGQGHGFFNKEPWASKTLYLADEFLAAHGYTQGKPTLTTSPDAKMTEVSDK